MPKKVRNDSPYSYKFVKKQLAKHGVVLRYGDCELHVMKDDLEKVRKQVSESTPEERQQLIGSVNHTLQEALPKMLSNEFTKETADNFYADILLWEALKEMRA